MGRRSLFAPFAITGGAGGYVNFEQQLGNTLYNSDGAHIVQRGGIVVPSISVRDILAPFQNSPQVVAMKIDIEGEEFSLFQTMFVTNLICTSVKHVTAEIHKSTDSRAFTDFLQILSKSLRDSKECRLQSLTLVDDETYSSSTD
jgi:hypothetical protein